MNQTKILMGVILLLLSAFGFMWWSQQNQLESHKLQQAELMKILAENRGGPATPDAKSALPPTTNDPALSDAAGAIPSKSDEIALMRREIEALKLKGEADLEEKERLAGELDRAKFEIDQRIQKIVSAPMLTKVSQAVSEHGFVVIGTGKSSGIESGDEFSIRRDNKIICRIRIGQNIEETEAVADPLPGTMAPGEQIKEGDEVVSLD